MSIRPLDMQVMVPKLQEVAQMKHLEQQKAGINQQDISHTQDKKNEKAQSSVGKAQEDNMLQNQADAKEKGKNTYHNNGSKKDAHEQNSEKPGDQGSGHRIDIKI